MTRIRPRLTYANVVATLALFLALTGGAVWAASKINGKQIKKNSIPGNRIKKGTLTNNQIKKQTITNAKIKQGTIQRTSLAAGTLPGVIVADASATNLPGATTETPPGPTPFALTGTTSFVPAGGRAYQLSSELVGNPVPTGSGSCSPGVEVEVNGVPIQFVEIFGNEVLPPFPSRFPEGSYTSSLLNESGTQTISAKVYGDEDCGGGTALEKFRVVVVELG
ncbi:MAG TPA: hypothetical protein VH476_11495 [Solirubrobacterales bacterium]